MIHILEKDYLEDEFIIKEFTNNIKLKDKLKFNKNDIYYFGNYKKDKIDLIEKKLIRNKKAIINAVKKDIKFFIYGNSINLFNNSFNHKKLNIFNMYDNKIFKRKRNKLKFKKNISNNTNFKYKNIICLTNKKQIKKQSISTLSY